MKSVHISAPAADEFAAAVQWYEARRQGLGAEFNDAVARAIDLIRTHPEIGAQRPGRWSHRRLRVPRFPYTIVYRVRGENVAIVAVAHNRRRPGYWKTRT